MTPPFVARNIDEVLAGLGTLIEASKARGDRLGYFAALYRQVTSEVKRGIADGRFEDGPRMDRFDTLFANRYFAAVGAWQTAAEPARSWRVSFELLAGRDTIILQHLLLAMNAHINYDLALATVAAASGGDIAPLTRDYLQINEILVAALNHVQAALGEVSPFLWLLDELGGRADEWALDFSIRKARDKAWQDALALSRTPPADRPALEASIDQSASVLGRLIARPAGILQPALTVIAHKETQDVAKVIDQLDRAWPR